MGFLLGRKDREQVKSKRSEVAKKSAAVLAAVAVAGGSAVVGMPSAEAAAGTQYIYWEKMDPSGKPVANTEWELRIQNELSSVDNAQDRNTTYIVVDNLDYWDPRYEEDAKWYTADQRLADLDPRPGHFLVVEPPELLDEQGRVSKEPMVFEMQEETDWFETGYGSCIPGGESYGEIEFSIGVDPYTTEFDESTGKYRHILKDTARVSIDDVETDSVLFEPKVRDKRFDYGASIEFQKMPDLSDPKDERYIQHLPKEIVGDTENWRDEVPILNPNTVFTLGTIYNCRVNDEGDPIEYPTPTPSVTTETTTVTQPVTTTVTPPTTTVTMPSTVTTTVTPPATTVTQPPKTETTTATTTESATTTVTEPPKTETVTETPQRETVTETPTPKTETVTETPQKETVTETPKAQTVTETPKKETVTETPKASTETKTSTVTAPQVTVTETPKQVTETTTLPQKTVTQQVPTTVVKDQTETVKMPPVTVTETEKQEPVTVSALPQTVTETVKVPGENTTVVVTEPGEPTTVRETVTEETTSVVPVVVDGPKPSAPAPAPEQTVEAPVEVKQEPANGVRRMLATTGAETNVVLGLGAGVLAMLALVAIVRRKKA